MVLSAAVVGVGSRHHFPYQGNAILEAAAHVCHVDV